MRLMQRKTAAQETPDYPAVEGAPEQWVELVQIARKKPVDLSMTLRDFVRAVAGLVSHLGRKRDGEPEWITLCGSHPKQAPTGYFATSLNAGARPVYSVPSSSFNDRPSRLRLLFPGPAGSDSV
jgi:hypothetical protein